MIPCTSGKKHDKLYLGICEGAEFKNAENLKVTPMVPANNSKFQLSAVNVSISMILVSKYMLFRSRNMKIT